MFAAANVEWSFAVCFAFFFFGGGGLPATDNPEREAAEDRRKKHDDDSHWTRVSDQSGVVAGSVEKHPLAV